MQKRNKVLAGVLTGALVLSAGPMALAATANYNDSSVTGGSAAWQDWVKEWETVATDYTKVSLTPGADETQLNFAWYSKTESGKAATPVVHFGTDKDHLTAFTGKAAQVDNSLTDGVAYDYNHVTVTGLEANTTYYYTVEKNGVQSEVQEYKTGSFDSVKMLYVGDPQIGASKGQPQSGEVLAASSGAANTAARNDAFAWNRTLEIATAQNPGVNFIISAGDQVNKTGQAKEEEYAGYLSPAVLAGLPVATTIGNHDKSSVDYTGDTYRDVLGPRWYSFNRGEVHFVAMDNCLFSGQDYTGGFTDEQVAWLEKDLSFVPTSKMIVLYYHIPLRDTNYRNRQKVLDLISKYQNPTLMCAHTHYFQPYHMRSHNLFERIHGGTCGYFWRSNCGGDGTPNGFMVYEIDGTKIVDTYFKASQRPDDHQIRLYHGDAVFAGPYATYKYDLGADVVVANVFAAGMDGTTWKVELSEDGGKTWSDMSPIEQNYGDRWIRGYHIGVEHHPTESGTSPCYHQYQYKLKDAAATAIEVRATDSFGHVYTQDTFTADNDFTEAEKY